MMLNKWQRSWLRAMWEQDGVLFADPVDEPSRRAFLRAKGLYDGLCRCYVGYVLNGDRSTAEFTVDLLRVSRRYLAIAEVAYLGVRL
jgi:hypothetical protein